MDCPVTLIGPEYYFGTVGVVVGGLVWLIKKIPFVKADVLPFIAFALGWAIDAAIGNGLCGESYTVAGATGLAGAMAALVAVGGHELMIRTARAVNPAFGLLAERLLGKASGEYEKQGGKDADAAKRTTLKSMVFLAGALVLSGCDKVLKWVSKAGDIVSMVTKWLDLIEGGQAMWFEDNPDEDLQSKIVAGIAATRTALDAVAEIGKAASSYSEGEQKEAELALLAAYRKTYKLVESINGFFDTTGALSAPPEGERNPRPGTPDELELAMAA